MLGFGAISNGRRGRRPLQITPAEPDEEVGRYRSPLAEPGASGGLRASGRDELLDGLL